jgi:hypothetical protein
MVCAVHGSWLFSCSQVWKKNQFWGAISALIITTSLSVGSLSFRWAVDMSTEYSAQNDETKRIAFWLELAPPAAAIVIAFKKRIRGDDAKQNGEKS